MSFGAVLAVAVGLAMDATAVACSRGMAAPRVRAHQVAVVAILFGGAQAVMPLLGWLIGSRLGPAVAAWDHWVAFVLLIAVGGKMLWQARGVGKAASARTEDDVFGLRVLLVLALATSIDAFAVGVTLPLLRAPMVLSLITIGVTTAVLSALGVVVGRRWGRRLGPRLDALGGLVLVGLAVKILTEQLLTG